MVRSRGKNIDEAMQETIIGILSGWSGRLSWSLFLEAVRVRVGHLYTRQTLSGNEMISLAYATHRKRVRGAAPESAQLDSEVAPEVRILQETNERLKAENARLSAENNAYIETFTTWAHNASNRGLTNEYLNTPLPKVDREQTREKKLRKVKG